MGIITTTTGKLHRATRVLIQTNGQHVSVELRMNGGYSPETMFFQETHGRLGGPRFNSYIQGTTLVLDGVPTRNIRVSNTGSITVTDGGFANTGVVMGGTHRLDPNNLEYDHYAGPEPQLIRQSRGWAKITITVASAGCGYAFI